MNPSAQTTHMESQQLLALARQKSQESRARLAQLITDLFDEPGRSLNEGERTHIYRILHDIIHEIEITARRAIASRIAARNDVPRELAQALANDEIEVAYPVLTKSKLLKDEDLIEIVRNRALEHQLAVAARSALSESVSDALARTGGESVVVSLLKNKDAAIAQQTMEYLVEQSQRVDSFREPILSRKELQPQTAKRMFVWVSLALREYIIENFQFDENEVDDLIEDVIAAESSQLTGGGERQKKSVLLAETLSHRGLITTEMLIAALREGEFQLFTAMFGRLIGLRDYLVTRLAFEPGGEGLAIACKTADIGKVAFATIYALTRRHADRTNTDSETAFAKELQFFDGFTVEAAREVMQQWRRGADYLNAIRAFNEARNAAK
ncbi:MAG: DUF2336 domain-containing protein [Alphaproteobacteria bacterium]|nr:DUF2336 domain-containing protein [Alphaproteobacteria bacterium]